MTCVLKFGRVLSQKSPDFFAPVKDIHGHNFRFKV